MGFYFEVWSRPGDPNFGRVIDDPPFRQASIHDGVNLLGDGTLQMPSSFNRFDDILYQDRAMPSASNSSLVRCWDDVTGAIVHEWLPAQINPTAAKNDPYVDVAGEGIKEILTYPVTGPYRSGGASGLLSGSIPSQPDWEWGGANVLSDGDMESPQLTPSIQELIVTATGGNYTIDDGVDTTAAIAFNASAATIETRLETDITSIIDVVVVQTSSSPRTFLIQFVDPLVEPLSVNTGGLSGGTATITEIQPATILPSGWQKASVLVNGVPQNVAGYDEFAISTTENHTPGGQYSLAINPGPVGATSNRRLGAQQVVRVNPDSVYQASVWIFPTSGTDLYRLGLFTVGEEIIALSSNGGVTLTPSVWNEITITDLVIPEGVTQAIFRVQNMNQFPSDPSIFYMDDAALYLGEPPGTVGTILGDLYASYIDPIYQASTIYWDDGSATDTPYLTLDFDGTNNSAGVPWANSEVQLRVYMRQNFYQALTQLATMEGIEFRVVPDDEENGTWLLQVYDEGQMSTDYTTAAGPAIQGGSSDTTRQVRRFRPSSSFTVEGVGRLVATVQDGDLMDAFGKIGAQRLDREAVDATGAVSAANGDADDAFITGQIYSYELVEPTEVPGVDYILGDILTIHDPPEVDGPGRFWDWIVTFTSEAVTHEVQFFAEDETSPSSP